nr:response regulator transcription factor [uncultured Acetatifactor sp.]
MKKRKKRGIAKAILRQYFFTYFIVLFIPLLICCNYYIRILSVISEDDILQKKTELLHSAELVDDLIEELTYLADMLAGLPDVNIFRFQENVLQYPNTHKVNDLQDTLFNPTQINQSIFACFLFFDRSQVVINDHIAYDYEDFYDLYLRRDADGNYGAWENYLSDEMGKGINALEQYSYKGEGGLELLAYSRPLPNNGYSASSGAVRIFFERSVLDDFMSVTGGSLQYILDDFGNVIYYTHSDILDEEDQGQIKELIQKVENARQEDMEEGVESEDEDTAEMWEAPIRLAGTKYVALRYSPPTGYTYCTLLQETQLNARKMTSMLTITVFILLAAAVGLFLCWHMSVRSATPLNKLLKEASRLTERNQENNSIFVKLSDIFQYLAGVNSDLVEMMEEQKPYIRNALVNRLLFGNPLSQEEEDLLTNRMEFDRRDKVFCVLIFRIITLDSEEEKNVELLNTCLLSLMEMIQKEFPGSLYAATGEDQVSLVLGISQNEQDSHQVLVEEGFKRILTELPENIAERIFVYGGNVVEELADVYESYHNAAFAFMNERERTENQIIWFQKNKKDTAVAFPYFELSVKLTRLVTSGEEQGLHDALEEVMTEYILKNNLPPWLQQILLNELQAILFRILVRLELDEQEYQKYFGELEKEHRSPLIEQLTSTLGLYRSLCALVNEKKSKEAGKMIPAILAFLDTNYGDPNLSLTMVADTFQISVPYLSSLFKASAGVNFSNYVEAVRIEKAKGLLKNTSMSVGEIAVATGYGSTNSFSRAFRRVTGDSASEYRKNYCET